MENNTKNKIKFDGAAPLPIMLYLMSIGLALMKTLCRPHFIICSAVMCALTGGIFLLFYFIRKRTLATALCVIGFVLTAWLAGNAALYAGYGFGEESFMYFLFNAAAAFNPLYAAAAIYIFSVIIGFVGYFFSVSSPRPGFLLLLMFIPMILSSRTQREIPTELMLIMAGCYIFACCNLSTACAAEKQAYFDDKSSKRIRMGISALLAAATVLLANALPKPTGTPLESYLDSFVPKDHGYFGTGLGNFTNSSSVNNGANSSDEKLLFTVSTPAPGLLIKQSFDVYNGEKGWTIYRSDTEDFDTGFSGWQREAQNTAAASYLNKIYDNSERLDDYFRSLLEGTAPPPSDAVDTIISIKDDASTRVVIHPANEISVWLPESCGRSYRNAKGEIFTEKPFPQFAAYSVKHYPYLPDEEFLRRMNESDYFDLLSESFNNGITTDINSDIYAEINSAEDYKNALNTDIPPEIQALAEEITAGLDNDYDKARAIEKWFGNSGFLYDLKFVPGEATAEYFLFESKTGICSDFATAVTLLARAAGLPARYCEGYAMTEETFNPEDGLYYITTKQAHAFTQVYLYGAGWICLDATKYVEEAQHGGDSVLWAVYLIAGTAAAAIAALLFRKQLSYLFFVMFYPLKSSSRKISGVYRFARELAAKIAGKNEKTLTCGEVCEILSKRLNMPQEAETICSQADMLFYSQKPVQADERLLVFLKELKNRKRRMKQ